MKIAICDDNQMALAHVEAQAGMLGAPYEISSYPDATDLLRTIKDGADFDAILMDIEWGGEQKGIDFAAEIYRLSPKAGIIFITGYPERYSQQIFLANTNLKGFVAKPVDAAILQKNLEKIQGEIAARESRKLTIKSKGRIVAVDPDDVLYIASRAHTATLHLQASEYLCYEKLEALAMRLPGQFLFTHKSFLVNMDKIRYFERERAILEDGREVPVSKSRQAEALESYFRYIRSMI